LLFFPTTELAEAKTSSRFEEAAEIAASYWLFAALIRLSYAGAGVPMTFFEASLARLS
jgi:hypothetical protein